MKNVKEMRYSKERKREEERERRREREREWKKCVEEWKTVLFVVLSFKKYSKQWVDRKRNKQAFYT